MAKGHLWDKGTATDAEVLRYTSRDDHRLDQRLLPYDLRATLAHARGLGRINVLDTPEVHAVEDAIAALVRDVEAGSFVLTQEDEDGHTAIECRLVERLGDLGKKIHTGRSRNDQVLVALRLFELDALAELRSAAKAGARSLLALARREERTPMPGYTHLQQAMPSSVGHWAASIVEGLLDSLMALGAARRLCDRSPLGAASSFGVNLPLDAAGVAAELGFSAVFGNALGSQTSRGLVEHQALAAAWHLAATIRRFAWDVSLFTTSEFGFVRLRAELCTGSSLMPNKKNPDVVEIMRGSCALVEGALAELQALVALPSGYHRDLQLTKAALFRGLDEALATARMLPLLVDGMELDRARMRAVIEGATLATDRAIDLAKSGVPFRDAYRQAAGEAGALSAEGTERSLSERVSPGAPGNLGLDALEQRLDEA